MKLMSSLLLSACVFAQDPVVTVKPAPAPLPKVEQGQEKQEPKAQEPKPKPVTEKPVTQEPKPGEGKIDKPAADQPMPKGGLLSHSRWV